jgi:polysaccharide biosynthesis protein PslH
MMRVLYLTHHLPWPPRCGGRIREAMLLERLMNDFVIDLVVVTEEFSRDAVAMCTAMPDGISAYVFPAEGRRNPLVGPYSRRYHSRAVKRHLAEKLANQRYDVVHVEGHFLLPLLPFDARSRAVLVEHNVESSLFSQQAARAEYWPLRARNRFAGALTRRDEMSAWKHVASLGMVTKHDANLAGLRMSDLPVQVLPNGFDHLRGAAASTGPSSARCEFDLVMVGNYLYQPSEDAAIRLLTEIYPRVANTLSGTTLALVGKSPSEAMRRLAAKHEHVTVTGEVDDVGGWLDVAKVFVAPLRIGGGLKVKVVEALVRGPAVVTTSIGVQGLEHIAPGVIAAHDDDEALAAECVRLLQDAEERRARESRARDAVRRSLPTWDDAADHLRAWWHAKTHSTELDAHETF